MIKILIDNETAEAKAEGTTSEILEDLSAVVGAVITLTTMGKLSNDKAGRFAFLMQSFMILSKEIDTFAKEEHGISGEELLSDFNVSKTMEEKQ